MRFARITPLASILSIGGKEHSLPTSANPGNSPKRYCLYYADNRPL